jgi:hypothetical protein
MTNEKEGAESSFVQGDDLTLIKKLKEMTKEEIALLPSYTLKLYVVQSRDKTYETYSGRIHLTDGIDVSFRLEEGSFYSILKARNLLPLRSSQTSCAVKVRVQKGKRKDSYGNDRTYYLWECLPSIKVPSIYLHGFFANGTITYLQMCPELEKALKVVDRGVSLDDELLEDDGFQLVD